MSLSLALAAASLSDRARALVPIVLAPNEVSSAGFPFLSAAAFETFRDTIPHLFAEGSRTLAAADELAAATRSLAPTETETETLRRGLQVVRTIVRTAAITAPSDLWLLRAVLGAFAELGLATRLNAGDAIVADACFVRRDNRRVQLDADELATNLSFLEARGLIERREDPEGPADPDHPSFVAARHPRAQALWAEALVLPAQWLDAVDLWGAVFSGESLPADDRATLQSMGAVAAAALRHDTLPGWLPSWAEVELGFRVLGLVLGLRVAGRTVGVQAGASADASLGSDPRATEARSILSAAGAVTVTHTHGDPSGVTTTWTAVGARMMSRGPGPMGIIEAYRPYMACLVETLVRGRAPVWVSRKANVAASRAANAQTFTGALDALARFCVDHAFSYDVFIEHAMGEGEAIRQRWRRPGGEALTYVGADLEDASIDAAIVTQDKGELPAQVLFVRNANIGRPEAVTEALAAAGISSSGAVMIVGNGFHEVRDQSDSKMTAVFQGYHDAGLVLLFTEASALSVTDLLATAWNTYHAGFTYVHDKSGQGLRPAYGHERQTTSAGLRGSWDDCAQAAGYVRMEAYCPRSRTIYPYKPASGENPSISVTHFFVPATFGHGVCPPQLRARLASSTRIRAALSAQLAFDELDGEERALAAAVLEHSVVSPDGDAALAAALAADPVPRSRLDALGRVMRDVALKPA